MPALLANYTHFGKLFNSLRLSPRVQNSACLKVSSRTVGGTKDVGTQHIIVHKARAQQMLAPLLFVYDYEPQMR